MVEWFIIFVISGVNEGVKMGKITENYGELVFNQDEMKKRLTSEAFDQYMDTINNGASLNESIANDIARAVKEWAIEKGASHFTHWFQPQRSGTAEKHDAFIDYNGKEKELRANGLLSTCIQHEVDHLNGVLFIDYLSKIKKDMIIKKLIKYKKEVSKIIL